MKTYITITMIMITATLSLGLGIFNSISLQKTISTQSSEIQQLTSQVEDMKSYITISSCKQNGGVYVSPAEQREKVMTDSWIPGSQIGVITSISHFVPQCTKDYVKYTLSGFDWVSDTRTLNYLQ